MDLIIWIIVGMVAGVLARMVVPVEGPGVTLAHLVIGVIGAVLGGCLFRLVLGHSDGGWIGSTFVAFVGAVVVLWLLRAVVGKNPAT